MLCWMIVDAYLTEVSQCDRDREKLNYFYQNNCDFKTRLVNRKLNATKLKELSPIKDMRPNSEKIVYLNDENNLEQVFDFLYQIRCNLFHGAKNVKNSRDYELVSRGAKFLRAAIDNWMK